MPPPGGAKGPVPTRFRCKVGGEWKTLDAFSNNQRKMVQFKLDAGTRVDAAHSGMVCREHSASFTATIRCELCGLAKDRSQFSKASLRNEVFKCVNCVAWTETQEPDVTPAPLATGHVSVEEEGDDMWKGPAVYSGAYFGEDALPQAPITALSSLGLNDEEQKKIGPDLDINSVVRQAASLSASANAKSAASRAASQLPPHLRSAFSQTTSTASDTGSEDGRSTGSTSSRSQGGAAPLPPHLRTSRDPSSRGRDSNSLSTATTMKNDEKATPVAYNAWDSGGLQHQRIRTASTDSSAKSVSLIDYSEDETSASAKEEEQPFTTVQYKRGNKGWHKAPRLTTAELHAFGNETTVNRAKGVNPQIDYQRRNSYIDLEDLLG